MAAHTRLIDSSRILSPEILDRVGNYKVSYASSIENIVSGIFNACIFCQAARLSPAIKKEFFRLIITPETAGKTVLGCTVLMEAARRGHIAVLRVLLLYFFEDADVYKRNEKGMTALMRSCHEYSGWDGSEKTIQDADGHNVLLSKCYLEGIKLLLKFSSDLGAKDRRGRTALHYVCMGKKGLDGMKLLLEHKADPNAKTLGNKLTPSHILAQAGNLEGLKILNMHKANLKSVAIAGAVKPQCMRPIHFAAKAGHLKVIKWLRSLNVLEGDSTPIYGGELLKSGFNLPVRVKSEKFVNASHGLRLAVRFGHYEVVKDMLCIDLSIEIAGNLSDPSSASDCDLITGYNSLHTAIEYNKPLIARHLIKFVNLKAKNKNGEAALTMARRLGRKEIFHDLLIAGAIED